MPGGGRSPSREPIAANNDELMTLLRRFHKKLAVLCYNINITSPSQKLRKIQLAHYLTLELDIIVPLNSPDLSHKLEWFGPMGN